MTRWKARVELLLRVIELFLSLVVEALQGKTCQNSLPSGGGRSLGAKISGARSRPPANMLIPLERQLIALQHCRWHFYTMKLCSRLFVLYCRNCLKDDKCRYFIPILRKFRGSISPWLMARWKARVEFLLSVIELLFLSLVVEALQNKMCQNSLPSGGGRSLGAKTSGGRGRPPANILIPLESQLIALQLCRWHFLYNETLQQTFRSVLSKLSKRRQI